VCADGIYCPPASDSPKSDSTPEAPLASGLRAWRCITLVVRRDRFVKRPAPPPSLRWLPLRQADRNRTSESAEARLSLGTRLPTTHLKRPKLVPDLRVCRFRQTGSRAPWRRRRPSGLRSQPVRSARSVSADDPPDVLPRAMLVDWIWAAYVVEHPWPWKSIRFRAAGPLNFEAPGRRRGGPPPFSPALKDFKATGGGPLRMILNGLGPCPSPASAYVSSPRLPPLFGRISPQSRG